MRKDQCMHCEDPGCLRACPADGAIVQYANGIVDFQQENCIGCRLLRLRLPVRHPEVQRDDEEGLQVHALLGSGGPGTRAGLHQGLSHRLPALRDQGRHGQIAGSRAKQLREHSGFADAGVYDPQSIGGTHVIYVLHDIKQPERYGLPANPVIPPSYTVLEVVGETDGTGDGVLGDWRSLFPSRLLWTQMPQPEESPAVET